jgi:hypothetical protein
MLENAGAHGFLKSRDTYRIRRELSPRCGHPSRALPGLDKTKAALLRRLCPLHVPEGEMLSG